MTAELFDNRYTNYRRDRMIFANFKGKKDGEGVSIAVLKNAILLELRFGKATVRTYGSRSMETYPTPSNK